MSLSRRSMLTATVTTAFGGYALRASSQDAAPDYRNEVVGYGPLRPDPAGVFDLPQGFSYRVLIRFGDTMSDGFISPDKADGMACFPLDGSRVALIRNQELRISDGRLGPFGPQKALASRLAREQAYDFGDDGAALPGGCTRLIYNLRTGQLERSELALVGTAVNCAGGPTPWGSWLSCEETTVAKGAGVKANHGYVFEVPAAGKGVVTPVALTGLGRFQHEAAAVDPRTGVVYLTEDSFDHKGLFYRFLPNDRRRLAAGGRLQALGFKGESDGDARNWQGEVRWRQGDAKEVVWIDVDGPDNPNEDLRFRMHAKGAAFVGRGEGCFAGRDGIYFACTSSGATGNGQILRYQPARNEGKAGESGGRLHLFVEPSDDKVLDYGDNIAIAPWGHILVCEDRYSDTERSHLRGVTPAGRVYTIGRNVSKGNAELAGACVSPDGSTVFVNIYQPGMTLAITGPWKRFSTRAA